MPQRTYEIVLNGTPEENAAWLERIRALVLEQDPDAVMAVFQQDECDCGCHAFDGVPHRTRCKACGHEGVK